MLLGRTREIKAAPAFEVMPTRQAWRGSAALEISPALLIPRFEAGCSDYITRWETSEIAEIAKVWGVKQTPNTDIETVIESSLNQKLQDGVRDALGECGVLKECAYLFEREHFSVTSVLTDEGIRIHLGELLAFDLSDAMSNKALVDDVKEGLAEIDEHLGLVITPDIFLGESFFGFDYLDSEVIEILDGAPENDKPALEKAKKIIAEEYGDDDEDISDVLQRCFEKREIIRKWSQDEAIQNKNNNLCQWKRAIHALKETTKKKADIEGMDIFVYESNEIQTSALQYFYEWEMNCEEEREPESIGSRAAADAMFEAMYSYGVIVGLLCSLMKLTET